MKYFYKGIRIDEIVIISPSKNDVFPTTYWLKNELMASSMGTWESNVKAVEKILNANRKEALEEARDGK